MFNCYDTILQQQQREAIKSDKKMYLRGGSEAPAPNLAWRLRQERPGPPWIHSSSVFIILRYLGNIIRLRNISW